MKRAARKVITSDFYKYLTVRKSGNYTKGDLLRGTLEPWKLLKAHLDYDACNYMHFAPFIP